MEEEGGGYTSENEFAAGFGGDILRSDVVDLED